MQELNIETDVLEVNTRLMAFYERYYRSQVEPDAFKAAGFGSMDPGALYWMPVRVQHLRTQAQGPDTVYDAGIAFAALKHNEIHDPDRTTTIGFQNKTARRVLPVSFLVRLNETEFDRVLASQLLDLSKTTLDTEQAPTHFTRVPFASDASGAYWLQRIRFKPTQRED